MFNTGSLKGCLDLKEETDSGTIGAKKLSEKRKRTAPFMSKSLSLAEKNRGLELLVGPFNLEGFVLMSGRPGDDMELDMLSLTEETVDVLDLLPGDEW